MTKPVTLGEDVFERMLAKIYSCQLAPGDIINESSLAAEFGVSRGPVREAVRRLQGIQLVSREPYMKARVAVLSPEALLELFQMREALEGYACRLAAERMPAAAIARLGDELEAARGGSAPEFDFHVQIVEASRNQRIIDSLCGDLYHLLRIYRRMSGATAERKSAAFREHWQILRAIRARDGELAESLMRSHIARAAQHLSVQLPQPRSSGAPSGGPDSPTESRRMAALPAA